MLTRTDVDRHITMELETVLNHRKDYTSYDVQDEFFHLNVQRKRRQLTQG